VGLRGIVLMVFFAGSLPVTFVRPFYGILLWTIVAFLNPQSFMWGGAATLPWALAVAIPTIAGAVIFTHGRYRLATREVAILIAFWIWITITTVVSMHSSMFMHHAADTWDRWTFVSKVLLMVLLTIAVVDSFERLRILVLVIAGCFGFFVAKTLPFLLLTSGQFRVFGPENSMVADNNDFGLALNMTLPMFFFLARTESKPWVRYLFMGLFVATIPAIFFTYSRGALLGLVAVLGLMILQVRQRVLLIGVLILGSVVALAFAPGEWKHRMDPTRSDQVDDSAKGRLNAWSFAWRLASDYPITGGGFATFTVPLFMVYAPKALDIHGPHSVYFQLLAEHGFIGLGLYLTMVVLAFRGAGQLIRHARFYDDPILASYANMLRFSMLGFVISGTFLGRAYFDYFFTIVACLFILQNVVREEVPEDEPEPHTDAELEEEEDPSLPQGYQQKAMAASPVERGPLWGQ